MKHRKCVTTPPNRLLSSLPLTLSELHKWVTYSLANISSRSGNLCHFPGTGAAGWHFQPLFMKEVKVPTYLFIFIWYRLTWYSSYFLCRLIFKIEISQDWFSYFIQGLDRYLILENSGHTVSWTSRTYMYFYETTSGYSQILNCSLSYFKTR